ncbi:MAG: hypothetical protein JRF65_11725 [Deltaproteobacteria bacterium]|nr:hypothetical protein [Deltaproteobacteria bacterium]
MAFLRVFCLLSFAFLWFGEAARAGPHNHTTALKTPDQPILLLTDETYSGNPFGCYLGEILKTEGFLSYQQADISETVPAFLGRFNLVVLAETELSPSQEKMVKNYVSGGGKLLAMRPDSDLADLFGMKFIGPRTERRLQYLGVEKKAPMARGVVTASLQYHGAADDYEAAGAAVIAWFHHDRDRPSDRPAVVSHRFGNGRAVAFTYDLARSVALTRQGNPEWACTEGDGRKGIRPMDMFMRTNGDLWIDPANMSVPQADEQQRLFANAVMWLTEGDMPLPRVWYLPGGSKALLVMTGDGDWVGYTAFERVTVAIERYGGRWSMFLMHFPGAEDPFGRRFGDFWGGLLRRFWGVDYPGADQVTDWIRRGHEVGLHVDDTGERAHPTSSGLGSAYRTGAGAFRACYGRAPGRSTRHHSCLWYGWADTAGISAKHGVHMDFNYYYTADLPKTGGKWPHGYFTGSGLPQRFVGTDGGILKAYQLLTEWADETQLGDMKLSTAEATRVVRNMFDAAENGFYSVFVANFHPYRWARDPGEDWAGNMMKEAVDRGIPIWSGQDVLDFFCARNAAGFSGMAWNGEDLSFVFSHDRPEGDITLTVPARSGNRTVGSVRCDGIDIGFSVESITGRNCALFQAEQGTHGFLIGYEPPADRAAVLGMVEETNR